MTVHDVAFVSVQRVQRFKETLNEFKQTRLPRRKVGGRTEWEVRPIGGQVNCDCEPRCISMGPEGSEH